MEDVTGKPAPPDPNSFGIDAQYYEQAVEGARAWASHKRLPGWLKWIIRAAFFFSPGVVVFVRMDSGAALGITVAFALVTLGIAHGTILTLEGYRGSKLKRTVYDPTYNPNPAGYRKYAEAYANYQNQFSEVFLSNYWVYHSNRDCCGMRFRWSVAKWQALTKGATPCTNCGHLVRVQSRRELPRPFGKAYLPEELEEFAKASRESEQRREEAQKRMDESTAKIVARIQKEQERKRLKELQRKKEH